MKTTLQILLIISLFIPTASNASAQWDKMTDELTGNIDKTVANIEAFRLRHKDRQKEYFIKESDNGLALAEVSKDTSTDETEASYFLLYDEQGRLLSHTEVPTSMSGDWYMEKTHYFDRDGRTIMFKNYSYHYNSCCTFLLNVTTRYYIDSQFRVIKKITEYTDNDNKPIANPSKCEQYGTDEKDEDVMQPNYAGIQKRIDRNLIRYKKERIEQRIEHAKNQNKWNEHMEPFPFEYMYPVPFQGLHEIQNKSNKQMDRLRLH